MNSFKYKQSVLYGLLALILLYSGFISFKYFFTKQELTEYEFDFSTEELALTNFDILVGDGFLYIPESYYFEKQTEKEISGWRLNLFLNEEVIFEFTTQDPFRKYNHTLPMMSKIIYKQVSENSNLRLLIEYTMDGINYTIDEPIKLNKQK